MRRAPLSHRSVTAAVVALSVLLASCGGGKGLTSDTSSARSVEQAAVSESIAESNEVPVGSPIVLAGGLVTLAMPDGWFRIETSDALPPLAITRDASQPWQLASNTMDDVAEFRSDGLRVLIGREGQFKTAEFETWRAALQAAVLDGREPSIVSSSTYDWAGGTGVRTQVVVPDAWLQFDNVQAGEQLILVLTVANVPLGEEQAAEVDALLDSVVVDETVLPNLQHALDVRSSAVTADGGTFTPKFLAPIEWQLVSKDPVVHEGSDGGFVSFLFSEPAPDFALEPYLAELEADEFFQLPVTSFSNSIDGVDYTVLLDGGTDSAVAAMVVAQFETVLVTCRLFTPDNNELLFEMLDTLRFVGG
jgi:hypothetical protein